MKKEISYVFAMVTMTALMGCGAVEEEPEKSPYSDFKSSFDGGTVTVLVKTTKGDITLELDGEKAPVSVDNFLRYAESGFYKGTTFHRVIRNQVIQGGSFTTNFAQKANSFPAIKNESTNGLQNVKGSIAMARLSHPDTATSGFFINLKHNGVWDYPGLDGAGYAVFGKIIGGDLVVDIIGAGRTARLHGMEDVPKEPVVILDVIRTDIEPPETEPAPKPSDTSGQ